jgi:uncharacterized membrane protein YdjX (TVP38/TMEM64 family)
MKIFCFALAIAAIAVCAFSFQHNETVIISWIETLGLIAPIFFLLLYCLATLLFLPTMMLTLAGGVIFGPVLGTLFNLLGATFGAVCAFCISRYCVSERLAGTKNVRIKNLIVGVENQGWQFVALLRLIPIIPFNLVNYGLGVTRIKFSHYVIVTIIFLIPAEIIFTYCGYAGMDLLTHPREFYKGTGLILLPCVMVVLFVYFLLKRHKHHLIMD